MTNYSKLWKYYAPKIAIFWNKENYPLAFMAIIFIKLLKTILIAANKIFETPYEQFINSQTFVFYTDSITEFNYTLWIFLH